MKKNKHWVLGIIAISMMVITCKTLKNTDGSNFKSSVLRDAAGEVIVNPHPSRAILTPQQSLQEFVLPKHYHLQLVASEPMISQPVAIVWDGNGAMYVAEMNTYMQNVNGTGQSNKTCTIKRLEDTNGDGVMDKATVFIDSLVLPRMIMTLDDRLLVNETYTNNIYSYRDTKGTGHADEKTLVYGNNTISTSNLEHQKSGLVWNLDNRIYVTVEGLRYKYADGKLMAQPLHEGPGGQWGLANDDYGRLFFSAAGTEIPAYNFQQNPFYGHLDFKDQYSAEFQEPWPIIATPDVQGGVKRLRADSTLNHFTGCNGQSIYRGDKLPADLKGDYILPEPVGRIIRRAKVLNKNGKITMENAYYKKEFIASADANFRPVNTTTGPDGCLYIVDMYHGIIQESNWTREGSYLRGQILAKGFEKNVGRGRIYRLVYDGMKPSNIRPNMLNEPALKLVEHLENPNGWWRDNAQKLLVIRNDHSVVPALKTMASGSPLQLARIHALWTLDGLSALDDQTLFVALKDKDAQVRKTAVWISEEKLQTSAGILDQLEPLKNDPSADVRFQLALTLRYDNEIRAQDIIRYMIKKNPKDETLIASNEKYNNDIIARHLHEEAGRLLKEADKKLVDNGSVIFKNLCATCHGADGKGVAIATGGKGLPAPALAGNSDVVSNPDKLVRILLYGLSGPINGKNYTDVMPALGANTDEYIASALSYIRNDFGNKAPTVTVADVKRIRQETPGRTKNWTMDELNAIKPAQPVKK
jgi:mono/diheme cytochrome c family protein/glucose/arabinose dehydrogenase